MCTHTVVLPLYMWTNQIAALYVAVRMRIILNFDLYPRMRTTPYFLHSTNRKCRYAMRLRWKLVFLALLVAGGALIWQNDGARAQLIHELEVTRDFCNKLADGCEPWQVCD